MIQRVKHKVMISVYISTNQYSPVQHVVHGGIPLNMMSSKQPVGIFENCTIQSPDSEIFKLIQQNESFITSPIWVNDIIMLNIANKHFLIAPYFEWMSFKKRNQAKQDCLGLHFLELHCIRVYSTN